MKYLMAGFIATASFVFAQNLYESTSSFLNSGFCKTYICIKENTNPSAQKYFIKYHNSVKESRQIEVLIKQNTRDAFISIAALVFPDDNITVVDEYRIRMLSKFTSIMLGKMINPRDFSEKCLDVFVLSGNRYPIISKSQIFDEKSKKSINYVFYCKILPVKSPISKNYISYIIDSTYKPI